MKNEWVDIQTAAKLEGKSKRTIERRIPKFSEDKIKTVPGKGGKGGLKTLIHISVLSDTAQKKFYGTPAHAPAAEAPEREAGSRASPPPDEHGGGTRLGKDDFWLPVSAVVQLVNRTDRHVRRLFIEQGDPTKRRRAPDGSWRIHAHALPPDALYQFYVQRGQPVPDYLQRQMVESLDDVPKKARDIAYQWLHVINAFEAFCLCTSCGTLTACATQFCAAYAQDDLFAGLTASAATLLKKRRQYTRDGLRGLLPQPRSGGKQAAIHPEAKAFLFRHYLHQGGGSKTLAARVTIFKAGEAGWEPVPSERTLIRMLTAIPPDVLVKYREGPKAYEDKVLPTILRSYDFDAMFCWVGDHHQMDVQIEVGGKRFFPWLTAWMDMKSRVIVGWTLCLTPNADSIAYAMHRAVKTWGIPQHILIDNGKDYRSKQLHGVTRKPFRPVDDPGEIRLRGAFELLGMQVHFAQPYKARVKPIERFFRRLEEQFGSQWPGYRGPSTAAKPEKLEQERAQHQLLDLISLEELFSRWLEEEYHCREHRGRGMKGRTPLQCMQEERKEAGYASPEHLRLLLLKVGGTRTVRRHGIEIFGAWYRLPVELHTQFFKQKVGIRYDRDDLTKVFAYTADDVFIAEAQCVSYTDFENEDDYKAIRKEQKEMKRKAEEYYALMVGNSTMNLYERVGLSETPAQTGTQPEARGGDAKVSRLIPKPSGTQSTPGQPGKVYRLGERPHHTQPAASGADEPPAVRDEVSEFLMSGLERETPETDDREKLEAFFEQSIDHESDETDEEVRNFLLGKVSDEEGEE